MSEFNKGEIVKRGEKISIYEVEGFPTKAIVEFSTSNTDNDNISSNTSCNIFSLLKNKGVNVGFIERLDINSYLSILCFDFPVIIQIEKVAGQKQLKISFFLKLDKGKAFFYQKELVSGLKGYNRLLIQSPEKNTSSLYDNDKLVANFDSSELLFNERLESLKEISENIFNLLYDTFLFQDMDLSLLELRFGLDMNGRLVLSSYLDNSCMRLLFSNSIDMSNTNDNDYFEKSSFVMNTTFSIK